MHDYRDRFDDGDRVRIAYESARSDNDLELYGEVRKRAPGLLVVYDANGHRTLRVTSHSARDYPLLQTRERRGHYIDMGPVTSVERTEPAGEGNADA